MIFLLGLLKFLIIVLANIAVGYVLYKGVLLYFFCEEQRYFLGYKIPLTPGLLHRKKKWVINKLSDLLAQYLEYANNDRDRDNYLSRFEDKLFDTFHTAIQQFFEEKTLPSFIKATLAKWSEKMAVSLVKKISRSFIPYLIFSLKIQEGIDSLDEKIDIKIIKEYYNENINELVLYFIYVISGLTGIYNAIIFLLLTLF